MSLFGFCSNISSFVGCFLLIPAAFTVGMGEIFAVFLFPKAFGLHLFFIGPDFGRDAGPLKRLTFFALIDTGTEDVNDLVIFFLLFRGKDKGIRSRNEPETAGVIVPGGRGRTVQFPFDGFMDSLGRIQAQRKSSIVCLGAQILTIPGFRRRSPEFSDSVRRVWRVSERFPFSIPS